MPVRNDFAPGEFCWWDFNAHDMKAAITFYSELFGWSHMTMETPGGGPPYAFFTKGEAAIGGIGEMVPEMKAMGIPPMWNSYIKSVDCEATQARVTELGGTVTVPVMEVPGHGKLAFFLDPEGASFATWQATSDGGPGLLVGDPGGVSWCELMTRGKEKAQEFYGALVGWDFSPMPMGDIDYAIFKVGEKDAGGFMPMDTPQFEGVPAHWMIYFAVEDCDAAAEKAKALGGEIVVPPTAIPVGKFSVLRDSQGGAFSVIALTPGDC